MATAKRCCQGNVANCQVVRRSMRSAETFCDEANQTPKAITSLPVWNYRSSKAEILHTLIRRFRNVQSYLCTTPTTQGPGGERRDRGRREAAKLLNNPTPVQSRAARLILCAGAPPHLLRIPRRVPGPDDAAGSFNPRPPWDVVAQPAGWC
jgi:hypothetical protein